MIKETDASKNDERRVKNKLNPLTHKKKGETHIMGNQGMKSWKLGAFFVISLMLMVGMFTNTASAQTASAVVRVHPDMVTAQEVISSVTVTYTVMGAEVTPNTISVTLPEDWAAAYPSDSPTFGSLSGGNVIDFGASPADSVESSLAANASPRTTSYVTLRYLAGAIDTTIPVTATASITSPTSNAEVEVISTAMAVGDTVVVTFHNVMVRPLVTADLNTDGSRMADPVIDSVAIEDNPVQAPDDNDFGDATAIQVNHRAMSNVSVSPSSVKTEKTTNVVVRYSVRQTVIGSNIVTIGLPDGWEPAYPPSTAAATVTARGFALSLDDNSGVLTALPLATLRAMRSYVVLTTTLDPEPDTAVDDDVAYAITTATNLELDGTTDTVTIEVTGDMERGEQIVLTYYNVKVPELLASREPVDEQLTVTDDIVGSDYMANAVIEIEPTGLSTVSISTSPSSVEDASEVDVTVTYTVQDTVYGGNTVRIGLPENWGPAYVPYDEPTSTFESFGSAALPKAPRDAKRNTTSYVVLTKKVASDTSGKTAAQLAATTPPTPRNDVTSTLVLGVANAVLEVDVLGTMVKGDKITVAFHNVMVAEGLDSVGADAQFNVVDSIVESDYDSSAVVKVTPLKLGTVAVTSDPDSIAAGSMVNLKVKYTATKALSFGRIQVTLPTSDTIYDERQPGDADATYVTVDSSRSVELAEDTDGDPDYLSVIGSDVTIDVDSMSRRQYVTLTVHNLSIAALTTPRLDRYEDIKEAMLMDTVQVMVLSEQYEDATDRSGSDPVMPPASFSPSVAYDAKTEMGSDEQPTITLTRRILGELTVADDEVTAGSENDFTITYKATEALEEDDVIEVKLPADWPEPTPYNFNLSNKLEAADETLLVDALKAAKDANTLHPHAYLSGSISRLQGAEISVINGDGTDAFDANGDRDDTVTDDGDGWFVRIVLGSKGVAKNGTIVLKYSDATVQRSLTTDDDLASIEVFSGPSASVIDLPQFPVKEQKKVTVKHAKDGSGMVTFEFGGAPVPALTADGMPHTDASIPAGIDKDDALDLTVMYTPDGDMGEGEFELRLPSGWDAEEVQGAGAERSGRTVTVSFPHNRFGEGAETLEITLIDITVPNTHGNHGFLSKSKNAGGTLKQLSPRTLAFVGNAEAAGDTVKVDITPAAAYQNDDDVDFEIVLEANGPMHDSNIQITVPEGIADLQTDEPADPNHVRVSASVSGVTIEIDGAEGDEIIVSTGKLNAKGKIRVRVENVDLDGVSADPDTGFLVATRTRGSGEDLSDVAYESIEKEEDGTRSITGGLVRTVAGSGVLAVEPATIEQGSRNRNIKLTLTATTDLPDAGLDLEILVPSVVETELQEASSSTDGYVSFTGKFEKDVKTEDRLKIDGTTVTFSKILLKRGEKFVVTITGVDLLEETGNADWTTSLGGTALLAADNKPMVVVGTMEDDVIFEVVDELDIADSNPSYPASSKQSIRFKFTTTDTAIQPTGRLWFTVPVGWSMPSVTDKAGKATVSIVTLDDDNEEIFVRQLPKTGDDEAGSSMVLDVSGRSVILTIGAKGGLAVDGSVTIRYGTADLTAKGFPVQISSSAKGTVESEVDGLSIRGYFRVASEFRQRDAGTIWVDVTNAVDGSGTVALSTAPPTVRAGSTNNKITVVYTGIGTMDGGAVSFTRPENWGDMQEDPLERNHIDVDVSGAGAVLTSSEIVNDGLSVVANLKTFGKGDKITFIYGGGTGARDSRGAVAQADIGETAFTVESMGSADGEFVDIRDDDVAESVDPLAVEVKGAESGTGEAEVDIVANKAGEGLYDGETDVDEAIPQIHAGDDSTYIVFTYTPSQTIAEGELKFIAPGTWTAPQDNATDDPGYTYLEEVGGAVISNQMYDENTKSVTADIALNLGDQIKIHYGAENGGAEAPDEVPTGGYSHFAIAVKGTSEENVEFENIDDDDLAVRVRVQRSGGGMAEVSPMSVNAGDTMRAITVTYTADGQVDDGMLKLTIPATWDAPTSSNVMIAGGGANTPTMFGSDHTAAELAALAARATDDVDLGAMDVIVDNVTLAGGDTVVFTYTSAMVQGTTGSASFAVAIDSGDGPGTGVVAVDGMTAVTVEEAAPGSGTAAATTDGIVLPGSTENTLTFTYTAAGEASYPSDVRVAVTDDWTAPTPSNYIVTHKRANRTRLGMVEEKPPVDGAMVARVVSGETVMAGDEIVFTLEDVTAPAAVGSYPFEVAFRGQAIAANPMVIVQSAVSSKLAIVAPATVAGDAGAVPVGISIMIQDAAGGEAASATATTVNLISTNTSTGSFTADGAAVTMVTIPAGMSSAMVYYSDTRVGSTATIVASDGAGALDSATTTIGVTTSVDTVSSITVTPAVATVGDVTVTVTGTPGKGAAATFSVGELVTDASLTESATSPGTYTGTVTVVPDLQDGTHDVTATLGEASLTNTGALAIDTMMPSITLTAPALGTTVANGGSVTITATAGDGTGSGIASVAADVSTLDSTQTNVALTMGAAGSYSAAVAISDDNEALNGSKTITVTATDAAGNENAVTVMVTLDNMKSFTSTIPTGVSLFHVPLDVDGLNTVGDLKTLLGDAADLAIVYDSAAGSWNSRSDAVAITSSLGIILSMSAKATVTFDGDTWDGGTSTISLGAGANLIGLPVSDPRVTNVSDIAGLFTANVVSTVVVSTDDGFKSVGAAGDAGNGPVMGDAAYLVTASAAGNAVLIGEGWTNSAGTSAAPIALAGYNVDNQTPVLDVHGSVVDEITGLAREGFRVKVKNLSTKAALSSVSSIETADGYNMTFVDLKAANAARIGDVLEISADSPNPLIGVKPVRHIVTVDDVKNSAIQLENLIVYEIPAETELLRNYPNPFNPETWIPYHLSEDADVKLTIYDISGEVVRDIDVGHQTAAKYDTRAKAIYWDGRNRFGEQVASGIYFYHLDAGDFSGTRKMVILK